MQNQDEWYIARDGRQVGPLSDRGMREFARRGHLNSEDLVWRLGLDNWQRAGDISVFLELLPSLPEEGEPELPEHDGRSAKIGTAAVPVSQKQAGSEVGLSRLSVREFKRAARVANISHEEEGLERPVGLGAMVPSVGHSLQSQQKASLYYLNLIIGAVGWVGVAALTFVIVIAR